MAKSKGPENDGVLAYARRWSEHWQNQIDLFTSGVKTTHEVRNGVRVDTTEESLVFAVEKLGEMNALAERQEAHHRKS